MLKPLDKRRNDETVSGGILKHDFLSLKNKLSHSSAWEFVTVFFFYFPIWHTIFRTFWLSKRIIPLNLK